MRVAILPVRTGSKRLAKKNYLSLNGKTILERAIQKALTSNCFDRIFINTNDKNLEYLAKDNNIDFYLREEKLASDNATSDQVVLEFFNKTNSDIVYWLNTVSPFSTINDIKNVVSLFESSEKKSVISVNKKYVHSMIGDKPANFSFADKGFAKTQDLIPTTLFNYAIMGWKREALNDLNQGELFTKKTLMVETSEESSWILKTQDDFDRFERIAVGIDYEL